MPANPDDLCCLYWINDETCTDPSTQGYIGSTKNEKTRWRAHLRSGRWPPGHGYPTPGHPARMHQARKPLPPEPQPGLEQLDR
jgi:hypothetical protein